MEMVAVAPLPQTATFEQQRAHADTAVLQGMQFCHSHRTLCSLLRPVDFDVSGLPCEDNSRANTKRKFQHGRFAGCYAAWCKYHRDMQTPLLVLENTPEIRVKVVHESLGESYACLQLFVDPADAGHAGVSRPRTYIIFYNLNKLTYVHDVFELYEAISAKVKYMVQTRPSDYLVTSERARQCDLTGRFRKRKFQMMELPEQDCCVVGRGCFRLLLEVWGVSQ